MEIQILTCPLGHRWEHTAPGPVPADPARACPVCAGANQATLAYPSTPVQLVQGPVGPSFAPGQVLAGFEIIDELNRGGMGVIYKARQLGLNRIVVLKVITPDRLGSDEAMLRFRREVQS